MAAWTVVLAYFMTQVVMQQSKLQHPGRKFVSRELCIAIHLTDERTKMITRAIQHTSSSAIADTRMLDEEHSRCIALSALCNVRRASKALFGGAESFVLVRSTMS